MAVPAPSVLLRLARWSSALRHRDVSPAALAVARNCFVDTVGVAIAGAPSAPVATARALALAHARDGQAHLFGWPERLAAPAAAAVNATAAHALDFDDNCYAGIVHGSAIVLPAVLALAEAREASGEALLSAFIAGVEVEYALGEIMSAELYARGWWTTAVLGPVGAAAGAAHLLGLDADRTAQALGLALAGAGGSKAAFGTDAKALLAGRASEAGLLAALAVAQGASGPLDVVEHPRGFAHLFNEGRFSEDGPDDLGSRWRLLAPGIDVKRIPVCLSAHAAVDAVDDLLRAHGLSWREIREIRCDVPQIVADNLRHAQPQSVHEAKFSLNFAIAASLVHGDLGLVQLVPESLADPRIVGLMERIVMTVGPRWSDPALNAAAPEGAHVAVTRGDGTILEGFRAFPRGSAADPLAPEALRAKFRACTGPVIGPLAAEEMLGRLERVDELPSAADLFSVHIPGPQR